MKVIVAGSRGINDYQLVKKTLDSLGWDITEVIHGDCPNSPDHLGQRWAKENGIRVVPFPADWRNIRREGAVIRTRADGVKYDAAAGDYRNQKMAEYAAQDTEDRAACVIFWDGRSSTKSWRYERRGAQKVGAQVQTVCVR